MFGKWAKIIVKITQTKCLLFNIYEKKPEKGFSTIKAPEKIKSKASVILTSKDQMYIIGGEDRGQYQGRNFMYDFVTLEFSERQPMLEPRVFFGCIFFNDLIFTVGGWKE